MFGWFRKAQQPDQFGANRSPRWRAVRELHLTRQPACFACGTTDDLEVHHICDFSTYPSLELEPDNLLTLCGDKANCCHLYHGHGGNWRGINKAVVFDCLRERVVAHAQGHADV